MTDIETLDTLIQEIFVDSFKQVQFGSRTWYLSPFNADKVRREVVKEVSKDYIKRVPYKYGALDELDDLSAAIKGAGGITKDIYKQYDPILNAIARRLTGTNGSLYGNELGPDGYDRESDEVADEFKSMPDRKPSESGSSPNIYHSTTKEGTQFERDYEGDFLTTFRIFHQLHRANLIVKTVDIDQLIEEVNNVIKERDTIPEINLRLPYDEDTFAYEKIGEFNEAFGDYVTLNVFSIGRNHHTPSLVMEFKEPRAELEEIFTGFGVPLRVYSDEIRLTLREGDNPAPMDFYDREVCDRTEAQHFRLDTTSEDVSTYLLLGNKVEPFFIHLLRSYIVAKYEANNQSTQQQANP